MKYTVAFVLIMSQSALPAYKAWRGPEEGKEHHVLNHWVKEYKRGKWHTNNIEGMWSTVRRTIYGTHIHVGRKHLSKYLNEIAFRYMYRDSQDIMFDAVLARVVS